MNEEWLTFYSPFDNTILGWLFAPRGVNSLAKDSTSMMSPADGVWAWRPVYLKNKFEPPYHWQRAGWLYTTDRGAFEFRNFWVPTSPVEVSLS